MQVCPSSAPCGSAALGVRLCDALCAMAGQSPQIASRSSRLAKKPGIGGLRPQAEAGALSPSAGASGCAARRRSSYFDLSWKQGGLPLAIMAVYGQGMEMTNRFRALSVICAAAVLRGGRRGRGCGPKLGLGRRLQPRPGSTAALRRAGLLATGLFTASPVTASLVMASRRHTVSSLSTVSRVTARQPRPRASTRAAASLSCS